MIITILFAIAAVLVNAKASAKSSKGSAKSSSSKNKKTSAENKKTAKETKKKTDSKNSKQNENTENKRYSTEPQYESGSDKLKDYDRKNYNSKNGAKVIPISKAEKYKKNNQKKKTRNVISKGRRILKNIFRKNGIDYIDNRSDEEKAKKSIDDVISEEYSHNGEPAKDSEGNLIYPEGRNDDSVKGYIKIDKNISPEKNKIRKETKNVKNSEFSPSNVPYIIKNIFYDNTIGNFYILKQNRATIKALKNDSNKEVTFIINGRAQTRGPGYGTGKAENEQGRLAYHIKGYHHIKDRKKQLKLIKEQIKELHEKAGIKNPENRFDGIRGHSSGGNLSSSISRNKEFFDLGIKASQATAATLYGTKIKNLKGQAFDAVVGLNEEGIDQYAEARKYAIENFDKKPIMDLEHIAGEQDGLVKIEDVYDPHASSNKIVTGKGSTHVRTSGSDKKTSKILSQMFTAQKARARKKQTPMEYKVDIMYNYQKAV